MEVARIKKAENLPIYHPEREIQILDRVREASSEQYGEYISEIYHNIMALSRELQTDTLSE